MKITLQNYEEYFVRLIDDELSVVEASEVQLFLQQHPELQADLDAFRMAILQPDVDFTFPGKIELKQSVHEGNFEEYFSRLVDHDLASNELQEVEHFVQQNPAYRKQLDVYLKTKLVADLTVVYPDKPGLKKNGSIGVIPLYARYILSASVAAGLVLILFFKGFQSMPGNVTAPIVDNKVLPIDTLLNAPASQVHTSETLVSNTSDSSITIHNISTDKMPLASKTNYKLKAVSSSQDNYNLLADMKPMEVNDPKPLTAYRKTARAPYLVPVYEMAANTQESGTNNISNQLGSVLSIASVVGSEILKLSGRGDLLKTPETEEHEKVKEPFSLSIQTKKFAFYHKFMNKEKATPKK